MGARSAETHYAALRCPEVPGASKVSSARADEAPCVPAVGPVGLKQAARELDGRPDDVLVAKDEVARRQVADVETIAGCAAHGVPLEDRGQIREHRSGWHRRTRRDQ